ncbi:E3 ubiquitin-protein ligase TRIM39-like [Gouania willdenowi]|uniref:E3 ubiquitin-protein ligase TRIM39-like n=1 Tax=Gouania willdenowi TaxID=441366 RepID=A0A8C5FY63_GOUWI|nr:E3 ubiquitin-protein ligase TRIM39-like [Gouania willdenowi]
MSAANCLLTEEQLLCGICLDVFSSPVTLPCGHNFCKGCIMKHWENNVVFECPSCKYAFPKKLDLRVNTFISEMAAQFRDSSAKQSKEQHIAKQGDVPCDVCTKPRKRALKSCLVCLASYCETHLEPHLTASRLQRHQLCDPMENLEGRMCKMHDKPLELFCATDQTCVCMLCSVLDHKSHTVIPLKEQFEKKKSELGKQESEVHRMIQERRMKIQEIKHVVKASNESAEKEMADGMRFFSTLIEALESGQAELLENINQKQQQMQKQADEYIQKLEQEISELLKRRSEVEKLSRSKDQILFLLSFPSLDTCEFSDWSGVRINLPKFEGTVRRTVDEIEETIGKDLKKLLHLAELFRIKQSAVDVTLDPNTAHSSLVLSDDGKKVHHSDMKKSFPENEERFNPSCCVLGKPGFSSGSFYFEANIKGKTRWTVGVAKKSIERKGIVPLCPDNGHWTIWLKNENEYAALAVVPLPLDLDSKPETVGVFVDYDIGQVSFYDVDTAAVIYSFRDCKFDEKLHPFFSPGLNNNGSNAAPITIGPVTESYL